jgi:hypothetical protein
MEEKAHWVFDQLGSEKDGWLRLLNLLVVYIFLTWKESLISVLAKSLF